MKAPEIDILLVTATAGEAQWLKKQLDLLHDAPMVWKNNSMQFKLIHTGLGMVNTAYALGRELSLSPPSLVVDFGIAGAFADGPEMVEVVEIVEECFSELGAESPQGFLDLNAMGFPNFEVAGLKYFNRISNPRPGSNNLRKCSAITVNTVHGTAPSIAEVAQRWSPEVETMEGAAVFQACLMAGVPFQCYRGISNRVEPRNRANWQIAEAAEAVQRFVFHQFIAQDLNFAP